MSDKQRTEETESSADEVAIPIDPSIAANVLSDESITTADAEQESDVDEAT
jgi:hypothetical protein